MTTLQIGFQQDLFAPVAALGDDRDLEMAREYAAWRASLGFSRELSVSRYEAIFMASCRAMREGKRTPRTDDIHADSALWFAPGDAESYINAEPYLSRRGNPAELKALAFDFAVGLCRELHSLGELENHMKSYCGHGDPCGLSYSFSPGRLTIENFGCGPAQIDMRATFNVKDVLKALKVPV